MKINLSSLPKKWRIIIRLVLLVVIVAFIADPLYAYLTSKTKVVTVKRLDHKLEKSGSGDDIEISDVYLVFTEKDGVFKNEDSFWRWKFNSSDVQNTLTEGKKFEIEYYGWRIPWFSQYQNIVSAKEVIN